MLTTFTTQTNKNSESHIYVKNKCKNILRPITKDNGQAGNISTYYLFVFIQYFFCSESLSLIRTDAFEALLSYYSFKGFSLLLLASSTSGGQTRSHSMRHVLLINQLACVTFGDRQLLLFLIFHL